MQNRSHARVAFVTAFGQQELDRDLPPLLQELPADVVVWDDPDVDWNSYNLVVIRSTWDYVSRLEEFLAWCEKVPRLLNPPSVIRWNTNKRYLEGFADLAVPTTFIEPGESIHIRYRDCVVKPTVSAGSKDTARYRDPRLATKHVRTIHASGRCAMVQPYIQAIDTLGETGLIYIDGEFSHAIRKGSILNRPVEFDSGVSAREKITICEPSPEERVLADRVIRRAPPGLLYARVDLVPGPQLLEFEATEPALFLNHQPQGALRLAEAIRKRL